MNMVAMKMTHMKSLPETCDDCIYYGCKPHPYKGWSDGCELCGHCMDDDQEDDWIYAVIEANKNRFNDDTLKALEMGRIALEQPTVCDIEQIRAEIDGYLTSAGFTLNSHKNDIRTDILQIIDKYTKGQ